MSSKTATLTCPVCETVFTFTVLTGAHRKYCSQQCTNRSWKVKHLAERIATARAFVAEVNARTFCAHCGVQPVEWHNPDHVRLNRRKFRIGDMAGRGKSIEAIQQEMADCTPLCRRCHMAEDGRMTAFMVQARRSKTQPAKPCIRCQREYKPLRKGHCARCYDPVFRPNRRRAS